MKEEFKIWNDVSIGYWNSKSFIEDRIQQQKDWIDKLSYWLSHEMITMTRFEESFNSALETMHRLENRLEELEIKY